MEPNKLTCFSEGEFYYKNDYENIIANINKYNYQRNIIKIFDNNSFKFCVSGLLIINEYPIVIFPKSYKLPITDKGKKEDTILLLKTLLRYKREKSAEWQQLQLNWGNQYDASSKIIEALYILDDYYRYGELSRKHKIRSIKKSGRIDWNSTTHRTIPVIANEQLFYARPFMVSNVKTRDEIIQHIHHAIITEARYFWGWLYNSDDKTYNKKDIVPLPCSESEAIDILSAELRQNFIQRETELIKSMRRYLRARNGNKHRWQPELIITPDFQWIWENVCGYVLGNTYERLKQFIPKPVLHSKNIKKLMDQRPDIICIQKQSGYILDAKYYNYNNSFPGWHDVIKQIFYSLTINEELKNSNDFAKVNWNMNALLLPEEDSKYEIRYLGYIDIKNHPSLGKVYVLSLNTKMMLEGYIRTRNIKNIRKIIFNKFAIIK